MQRFIVGSGRCGSTLLTFMLKQHPDLAVYSEFYSSLDKLVWHRNEVMTGAEFRKFLDSPNVYLDIFLRRGKDAKEILADTTGLKTLPALFLGCMQLLSDDPEPLYAELLAHAESFPAQRVGKQVADLLDWLTRRIGKTCWLERSGPSITDLPVLAEMYPDALYVHLHRDGHEVALSMQKHIYFRLDVSFLYDPPSREDIAATEHGGHRPSEHDTFSRRIATELPAEKYGEYWSYNQVAGARGFRKLKPSQILDVQFEDVVSRPHETMKRIEDFLQLPSRTGWIDAAAKMVADGAPPLRFHTLPPEEQARLRAACSIGQMLLGREAVPTTFPTLQLIEDVARGQHD